MVEVADFHSYGDVSFLFPKGGAVGRQALPSLDRRLLFGEDAVIALDPIQDETGNHLPVRGIVLRAHAPVEVRPDGLSDPSHKLLPSTRQVFFHVLLPGRQAVLVPHCADKLLAAIHTVLRSLTSPSRVSLFTTLLGGDILINDFATVRAKSHRGVFAPVITVKTFVASPYHLILLPAITTNNCSTAPWPSRGVYPDRTG